jgi:hypothetical protein
MAVNQVFFLKTVLFSGGVEKPVPSKTRRLLQKLIFAAAHLKSCPECKAA